VRLGVERQRPKLVCINLGPTPQPRHPSRLLPERRRLHDAVSGIVASIMGDHAGRFVAEFEGVEL
jgi:hypothetical protein